MIASAASIQCAGSKLFTVSGNPLLILSIGRLSKITPVENGKTCSELIDRSSLTAWQVSFAFKIPSSPVPALAQPVLIMSARIPDAFFKCSLQRITGAAQNAFCVNTPETFEPSAMVTNSKSFRLGFLICALAVPSDMPLMGRIESMVSGLRLTGIAYSFLQIVP